MYLSYFVFCIFEKSCCCTSATINYLVLSIPLLMIPSLDWLDFLWAALLLLGLCGLSACGDDTEMTQYQDMLIGTWQLNNAGDLQPFYNDSPFILKDAQKTFEDDGALETRLLSSRDNKTWITETGTWSVTQSPIIDQLVTNESLYLTASNGPFDDGIYIAFEDERTFFIELNGLQYQFVKL